MVFRILSGRGRVHKLILKEKLRKYLSRRFNNPHQKLLASRFASLGDSSRATFQKFRLVEKPPAYSLSEAEKLNFWAVLNAE